jgi:fructokinase
MTNLAGIELGGTKCLCVLGTSEGGIHAQREIPTTSPAETVAAIRATLAAWTFETIGIASFGPLDFDPGSPSHGEIVNTPKPGWSGTKLLPIAADRPFVIDTDVNAAALAEGLWGGAQSLDSWAYITVGTGIGVGSIVAGTPLRGLGHSEAGHLRIPHPAEDHFAGNCPFHGDCVEGMASGPAMKARTGQAGPDIDPGHPAWGFAADALAALCHNLLPSLPQRIFFGGGIPLGQAHLLPLIRARLSRSLGGYGTTGRAEPMEDYIVPSTLGAGAGPLGALALARAALKAG